MAVIHWETDRLFKGNVRVGVQCSVDEYCGAVIVWSGKWGPRSLTLLIANVPGALHVASGTLRFD